MRGSVYYQSAQLVKVIFQEGAKKVDRVNPNHQHYQKIASYKTMESYRNVWNNMFNYLKEHWKLKDCEKIESYHVQAYIDYKIDYYPSKQYLQKIVSALGKLETALNMYSMQNAKEVKTYDFSIRKFLIEEASELKLVANNYRNRAYEKPYEVISNLKVYEHQIAAFIELEGGSRIEGCALIKEEQLKGIDYDEITDTHKGVIFTKEKGGKEGYIYIGMMIYHALEKYIHQKGTFKINRQAYWRDIRNSCTILNIPSEGTHGFRWNFAQRRLFEYAQASYTYEQSLQLVSSEMKHNRASITEHYIV